MTDAELIGSAVRSHVVWLRRGARQFSRVPGRRWAVGRGGAHLLFPQALGDEREALLDTFLEAARNGDANAAACWSLLPAPDGLGEALIARGFELGWQLHWMGIEQLPPPRDVEGVTVELEPLRGSAWRAVARRDGEFAGVANAVAHGDAAGVFDVYTPDAERRRGIGHATTRRVLSAAFDAGAQHATLNATELGARLYESLGFRSLGWGQTWWIHRRQLSGPAEHEDNGRPPPDRIR